MRPARRARRAREPAAAPAAPPPCAPPARTSGHSRRVADATGGPADAALPPGQASDRDAWRDSLDRIKAAAPDRVHFCHDTAVIHG